MKTLIFLMSIAGIFVFSCGESETPSYKTCEKNVEEKTGDSTSVTGSKSEEKVELKTISVEDSIQLINPSFSSPGEKPTHVEESSELELSEAAFIEGPSFDYDPELIKESTPTLSYLNVQDNWAEGFTIEINSSVSVEIEIENFDINLPLETFGLIEIGINDTNLLSTRFLFISRVESTLKNISSKIVIDGAVVAESGEVTVSWKDQSW